MGCDVVGVEFDVVQNGWSVCVNVHLGVKGDLSGKQTISRLFSFYFGFSESAVLFYLKSQSPCKFLSFTHFPSSCRCWICFSGRRFPPHINSWCSHTLIPSRPSVSCGLHSASHLELFCVRNLPPPKQFVSHSLLSREVGGMVKIGSKGTGTCVLTSGQSVITYQDVVSICAF